MGDDGAIHSTPEAVEANAHLIAAAPELLEALERIAGLANIGAERTASPTFVDIADRARAAIAKAREGVTS